MDVIEYCYLKKVLKIKKAGHPAFFICFINYSLILLLLLHYQQ